MQRFTSPAGKWKGAKQARQARLSTVRASRARIRGATIDPAGYDAGKKIKGKKRHILVDAQDFLMHALVHAADVQDHDGGALIMATLFGSFPFLLRLYADRGYQGPNFRGAVKKVLARVNVEIVKRSDCARGLRRPSHTLGRRADVRLAREMSTARK